MDRYCTLNELAALVEGEVVGDGNLKVKGMNGVELANESEITFVTNNKMLSGLIDSSAAACIVPQGIEELDLPHIKVHNPEHAAAVIHNHLLARPFTARGIHPNAYVGVDCQIHAEVTIGPKAVVGDRVLIKEGVTVYPGVVIGDDCVIKEDTILHPNVTISQDTVIGRRVIIHAGAAIGSDGFGFASDPVTGTHLKKPQVGNVQIDDDVEIGANSCVDRAAFGTTRIRSGTKIDNLVMVAHNVDIGENSILVAQVGIAGSSTIGRNVILGGQAGIAGHLTIGDRVMVAAASGVHNNLKEGAVVGGAPAFEIKKWGKATAVFSRLPEIYKDFRRLTKEVERLKELLTEDNGEKDRDGRKDKYGYI